ncbi:hypothetical protein GCM10023082_47660 [Streptomyces tremellae]|uniref:Uncharacterized protein n=1 Tax=Streptomyces tremellae TaxID=1124239 RepID=A0ABP7FQ49_9ACTN
MDAVFYPTPAESYQVAALDVTNKMRQVDRMGWLTPRPPPRPRTGRQPRGTRPAGSGVIQAG